MVSDQFSLNMEMKPRTTTNLSPDQHSRWEHILLCPQQGRSSLLRRSFCGFWRISHLPMHVSAPFGFHKSSTSCVKWQGSVIVALAESINNFSHYKSWRLTGLYAFCAVLFTAGFIVREMGAFDYSHLIKFIITICLVYAAPCVLFSPSLLVCIQIQNRRAYMRS